MRTLFPGHYPPTHEQLAEIWDRAIVVLDTNSLFHLLRYTDATRSDFLKALHSKEDQLWLPHHVAQEFQNGRLELVFDQKDIYKKLSAAIDAAKEEVFSAVDKQLSKLSQHPTLDRARLRASLETAYSKLNDVVGRHEREYTTKVIKTRRHDATTDEIDSLYADRIGAAYSPDELKECFAEGKRRYEAKIPPGFEDQSKGEPRMYGDWIIWSQMLTKGEREKLPMLFVSDDTKPDWIRHVRGEKKGPLPALIEEYAQRSGQRIHFMTPWVFIRHAQEVDASIAESTVREVEAVSEAVAEQSRVRRLSEVRRPRSPFGEDGATSDTNVLEYLAAESLMARERFRSAQKLLSFARRDALEGATTLGEEEDNEALRQAQRALDRRRASVQQSRESLKRSVARLREAVLTSPPSEQRTEALRVLRLLDPSSAPGQRSSNSVRSSHSETARMLAGLGDFDAEAASEREDLRHVVRQYLEGFEE